ncbi:gliding motility-associated C-terminal domain-containing protein [Fibrella sp. HMF5335]|uniref:Gliding motility-associated C-terminal domain-containing protein n=1 Tax=Fibrella rubiginis TaxID=2817060 RepID=A0A939K4I0_9BACT|nr:gliding motility-associated C-terminal domain-containing protein [Fibrella rubiginis]MBO0936206.1 gliding motility-associated C-terminal domain-containing protein [Fibrella rubiginis]
MMARRYCHEAQITVTKTTLCPGDILYLFSNILPSYRYRWFKDGVLLRGHTNYALIVDSPGEYTLEVTNTALADCVNTTSIVIRQSTLGRVAITAPTGGSVACEGNTLTASLTGNASPNTVYQWQYNYSDIPGNTPTLVTTRPGTYAVSVSDGICSVDANVVAVLEKPTILFPPPPTQCVSKSEPFPFYTEPNGGLFDGPGVQNNLFSAALAGVGVHTVTYSVTNAAGCTAIRSQTIAVSDVPQPDLGPNQTIAAGISLTLQGPVKPESKSLTYAWEPADNAFTGSSIQVQPHQTTTYRLTVSDNGQCPLSSSVQVDVLPGLFIPTAFTPNGDGQNDVWRLTGIEAFPNCRVRIFDRWGSLILDESPYHEPWNGRIRGERAPAGPYRFVINPAPTLPERSGTLVLVE